MKAIVSHKYGSPDVLNLEEIEKPEVKGDQVLVKIHATSANAGDWHIMRAEPFIMRLMGFGLLKPKNKILGADIAGIVEAVGNNVSRFQPGDEVYGDISECGFGAFAEYVSAPEDALALKPSGVSFETAAAVPSAAVTALQGLRDHGEIKSGQKVLVNGASGGVGTFAVQIAKSFGAEVTGVCSSRNLEMVRSIGADHVIDYTQEDFTQTGNTYDLIIDAAAYRSLEEVKRILAPEGKYVLIGGSTAQLFRVMLRSGKQIKTMMTKPNHKDLLVMKELLESGKVKPVIDKSYKLSETAQAIRHLEEEHARGKIVITVMNELN